MKKLSVVALTLFGAFAIVACDLAPEDESAGDADVGVDAEAEDLDEVLLVTRIELTDNGPGVVDQWQTTRRIQRAEALIESTESESGPGLGAAREAVASRTSGCQSTDFRMWSSDNYSGYQLCFYGTTSGEIDLHDHVFGGPIVYAQWAFNVHSFKSGAYSSVLSNDSHFWCNEVPTIAAGTNQPDYPYYSDKDWLKYKGGCSPS